MKKIFAFAMLALVLSFGSAEAAQKTYVNGIDANYPPFGYMDEQGKPAGFDVESMDWIAKTMGFKVEHKPIAWDGIIPALLAKQIDMVASGMSITDARRQMVEFSNPYWEVSRVFIAKKDSELDAAKILAGKTKIGIQRGTSEAADFQKEAKEKGYPVEIVYYESAPLIVEDMLNGRIQAGLMDKLPADDSISKGKEVKIVGVHGKPDSFGVAVRKDDNELRTMINEGYKKLMADPYWKELQDKYLQKK